jgi:hypothetical protein
VNNLQQTIEDVAIMLSQFKLAYKKISLVKDSSVQFIIQDFGLVVCCVNRLDYTQVNSTVEDKFGGWRLVFISVGDTILEKRLEVLWALMKGGYMKWLRYTYPRQIKNVLLGHDNLGQSIIKERLRVWNNQPKFKYLIEDNMVALKNGVYTELTNDPSFFDYMPE